MRTILLYPYYRRHSVVATIVACVSDAKLGPEGSAAICEAIDEIIAKDGARFDQTPVEIQIQSQLFWQAVQRETGRIIVANHQEDQPA